MEKRKIVNVIDLLCLISLNKTMPEKIKYDNQIYNYCDIAKDYYYTCYGINIYLFKNLFSKPTTFLNNKVEVIIEEILDDIEKDYLRKVIEPFRNRVLYIQKHSGLGGVFIAIGVKDGKGISFANLPHFKDGTMYKKMDLNRRYSLEELNL